MSHWGDLNSRPPDYESGALPTKLQWRQRDHLRHSHKRIGAVGNAKVSMTNTSAWKRQTRAQPRKKLHYQEHQTPPPLAMMVGLTVSPL